ncbi:MAG: hypothetical protein ACRDJ2_12790, partial [Actinomycetota bacterium]
GTPWAPWGGVGESGFGRLNGVYGIREFTVPTHIAANLLPHTKRIFWYPYGDATELALRSFTETLAAGSGAAKLAAARRFAGSLVGALREKL